MKKTKTKDETKMLRIRIIVSSILLIGFIVGWVLYGLSVYRSNPKNILAKFYKQDIDIDIKIDNNINYTLGDTDIGLYNKDDKLYIYGNNKYIDLSEYFKDNGLNVNYKELFDRDNNKKLIKGIREIILDRYDYVDNRNNYLEKSDLYVYNYTFNTSYLILSMSGDKDIMDILNKMFNADNDTIIKFLQKYNDKRIEYVVFTKGKKRNIEYYSIKVDDLFSIYKKGDFVTGFIGDIVYTIDGKTTIIVNDEDKEIVKNNKEINFEEYTKIDPNSRLSYLLYK